MTQVAALVALIRTDTTLDHLQPLNTVVPERQFPITRRLEAELAKKLRVCEDGIWNKSQQHIVD